MKPSTCISSSHNINRAVGIALATICIASTAFAEGFRNPTIGTFGLGRSGGRIAQVDDASAVQQNPANLIGSTNIEFQLTPSVVYISADFESSLAPGQKAKTESPWKVLPNLFLSMPLENDKFAVGLGITTPYGIGSEWNTASSAFAQPTGVLTYFAPHASQLTTININPTAAMKVNDRLQIGVGLDVMWSELEFKQFLSPSVPGLEARACGDGTSVGANIGITYKLTDRQRLALTYRSAMSVNYSGTTRFSGLPGIPDASFDSRIAFPNIVALGYGVQVSDTVRIEADFEWVNFARFKNLPVNIGPNYLSVPSQNIAQNWNNTFTLGIGGDWKFSEHWTLRAGYQYFQSPIPNSTFSPTIPDANQNVLTIGLGWKSGRHSLEAGYGLDFYGERRITGNQVPYFDGKYTFNVHLFSLSYRMAF